MSLTRDDMLKELELLPVWQLRNPFPDPNTLTPAPSLIEAPAIAAPALLTNAGVEPAVATQTQKLPIISENVAEDIVAEPSILAAASLLHHEDFPAATEIVDELAEINLPSAEVTLGQGHRESIMQLDWHGLQECVAHCEACGLSKTRTQTVFGVGDPNADWLIIGEAPGAEEDKQGEPFVGQAGKLLDNMLAAIQLKRGDNVYIANVLKCRPPQNRDPQGEEVMQCDPFLKRQVDLIKPKLILALGKFAAQSLLASEDTVASMRGKQHSFYGVPVVVTYHPAYLLRNLPDKAKAWEDLCMARELMQTLQSAVSPPSN